jgi:hypothetical protein
MYNPFPTLTSQILKDKLLEGKRYFVRQTFKRGMETGLRAAFLFRAYEENEKHIADQHMEMLDKDPNSFFYDVKNPEHLARLHIAARQPAGFKIYYAGKKGMDWKPPQDYQEKVRRYIGKHHPGWQSASSEEKIHVGLYEEFGELFLKFNFGDEEDKIPFDTIEKY